MFGNACRSKSLSYKVSAVGHELSSREVIAYRRNSVAINLAWREDGE
jgi:hypothetical protein